jgi:hypothetical protein
MHERFENELLLVSWDGFSSIRNRQDRLRVCSANGQRSVLIGGMRNRIRCQIKNHLLQA